jgi:phage replication-related protein YjqB (UPF0714/DUF867 family)
MGEQITLTPFQEALRSSKMLEFASIRSSKIGIMAFHAGSIEPGTEQIARYVAKKLHSSYYIVSNRVARITSAFT